MCWLNNAFWFQTINIDRYRVIYDNKDGLSIRDGAVIVLTKHLSSHKEFVEINSLEKIQNLLLLSWSKHLKVSSMFLPESIKSLDGNGLSKVINVMQSNNLFV